MLRIYADFSERPVKKNASRRETRVSFRSKVVTHRNSVPTKGAIQDAPMSEDAVTIRRTRSASIRVAVEGKCAIVMCHATLMPMHLHIPSSFSVLSPHE